MHSLPFQFSLRTLCLALSTCAVACGLLTWTTARPFVVPIALAIPLYWCGTMCMSVGAGRILDYHPLALIGCVFMSIAVMLGLLGPLFLGLLWLLSLIHS